MQNNTQLRMTFIVDLLLLAIAFPLLYFPKFFPAWGLAGGFSALIVGWCWRRWRLGIWRVTTPIDWPLFLLFFVMLPISIWAAPDPLRQQYSWPRAYILVWNFCLFWVVVIYGSLSWELLKLCLVGFMGAGTVIALVAPLGTNWLYKFTLLDPILRKIPSPLIGLFSGADSGFHPNQVAGTLLYVLPLMIALTVGGLQWSFPRKVSWWMLAGATALVLLVFFTTQSRGGFLGLAVGLVVMGLLPLKWGRWLLLIAITAFATTVFTLPGSILKIVSDAPPVEAIGGIGTLGFRQEVWGAALQGIRDFPFTGMGLGTFRQVVRLLYPVSINPNYDIGHAHNIFLQSALDFGIPGILALLAIYLIASTKVLLKLINHIMFTKLEASKLIIDGNKTWLVGLSGSLFGQAIYSQLDAVAMGSKTNFMFWSLVALIIIFSAIDKTIPHMNR